MSFVRFVEDFARLVTEQSEWSQKTFGSDQERGPIGPLKHLAKEAKEAAEASTPDELLKELADCFLLLLDANRRGKFTVRDLIEAALKKMEVNRNRQWPAPRADEPVEHVRENGIEQPDVSPVDYSEGFKRCDLGNGLYVTSNDAGVVRVGFSLPDGVAVSSVNAFEANINLTMQNTVLSEVTREVMHRWALCVLDGSYSKKNVSGITFDVKELRDEGGSVIHACAVGSFPLPANHWIYSPIMLEVKPIPFAVGAMRERLKECLRWAIQVCTDGGKDKDFDPDAMCMAVDGAFFANESFGASEVERDEFCVSTDGEHYNSRFATEQEAIDEAVSWGVDVFYVGKPEKPSQPEEFWCVDDWISQVNEQDDYGGEYAEDWYDGSREQEKELDEQVRPVLAAWLDKHKLRPKHWIINSYTKYIVVEGKVMTEAELNGAEE